MLRLTWSNILTPFIPIDYLLLVSVYTIRPYPADYSNCHIELLLTTVHFTLLCSAYSIQEIYPICSLANTRFLISFTLIIPTVADTVLVNSYPLNSAHSIQFRFYLVVPALLTIVSFFQPFRVPLSQRAFPCCVSARFQSPFLNDDKMPQTFPPNSFIKPPAPQG